MVIWNAFSSGNVRFARWHSGNATAIGGREPRGAPEQYDPFKLSGAARRRGTLPSKVLVKHFAARRRSEAGANTARPFTCFAPASLRDQTRTPVRAKDQLFSRLECSTRRLHPPNKAFQSDPRRPALYEIGRILTDGFDLRMPITARAAERRALARLSPSLPTMPSIVLYFSLHLRSRSCPRTAYRT